MEQKFNLCEIFPLDAMHDQTITRSELSAGTLSLHFDDLHFSKPTSPEAIAYYNKHKKYHSCTLTFFELDDADLFAEFSVEVYDFYCGYRCVIICGSLVDSAGCYHDDCVIKVSADTVEYQWHT